MLLLFISEIETHITFLIAYPNEKPQMGVSGETRNALSFWESVGKASWEERLQERALVLPIYIT